MARLTVSYTGTGYMPNASGDINMFDKVLSREAYNEWVVRNHYSKQLPLKSETNEMQIIATQDTQFYNLWAYADYKDPSNVGSMSVFHASVELSHDNWPVFQHFARLLTDPFINIGYLELIPQNVLCLLIEPDRSRLKCNHLRLSLR
ncbi:hypothetical protein DdX_19407 [Ditylenchus destructor]|uniref:Uncharacterized protein n=1 Tax=Ditylenchus destructor TaxID=166010 RepID=A0AAD4QSC4_9BILA|nr:hypothetical protein DdX_19407 [Ditylenchus destructor]